MNISKTLALSTLLLVSTSGFAQQMHHQPSTAGKGENVQHNMSGMDHSKMSDNMKEMQAHMLMMHELSNKILAETDPKKQQSLKNQQLEVMKAHHMQMMTKHHGDASDGKMQHDMQAMDPAKMAEHMKQKQEHMLMMHDLSNKILAEKDPKKQQTLKNQQLDLMKAHHAHMMSMHHQKTQ